MYIGEISGARPDARFLCARYCHRNCDTIAVDYCITIAAIYDCTQSYMYLITTLLQCYYSNLLFKPEKTDKLVLHRRDSIIVRITLLI